MTSSNISSPAERKPLLITFGGLPGTGKTTISRQLAATLNATYLRIDSIEQTLRDTSGSAHINEEGYRVAYAVAEDNLRLRQVVVADSVNPIQQSRDAWLAVAQRTGAHALEVEIVCSDARLHRQRVETRNTDIEGLQLPTWDEVLSREYEPWPREHIVIDTAGRSVAQSVEYLQHLLSTAQSFEKLRGKAKSAAKG